MLYTASAALAPQEPLHGGVLTVTTLESACALDNEEQVWLAGVLEKLKLSAYAHYRALRVALTLTDLEGKPKPTQPHLIEAAGYRQLDKLLQDG